MFVYVVLCVWYVLCVSSAYVHVSSVCVPQIHSYKFFIHFVEQLESIERLNQTEWKTDVVLPSVSFAPLILPSQESVKDLEALEIGEKNTSENTPQFCVLLMYVPTP